MLIGFSKHGVGNAKEAQKYLFRKLDSKGNIRAGIKLIHGNPNAVSNLCNSLAFKYKYTSCVIAWHKDDNPTEEEKQETLNKFIDMAFAGLNPNQYSYYAVEHLEDDGSSHYHIILSRVEMTTGKSYNIAPPGSEKFYNVLVEELNTKYDWAKASDAKRKKLVVQDDEKHYQSSTAEVRNDITQEILNGIESGTIKNQRDVLAHLDNFPGVTVQPSRSKKTISIRYDGHSKNIRLKGLAFTHDFDINVHREEISKEEKRQAMLRMRGKQEELIRLNSLIEDINSERAAYNEKHYQIATDTDEDGDLIVLDEEINLQIEQELEQELTQERILNDRDRAEVSKHIEDTKRVVFKGINEYFVEARKSLSATFEEAGERVSELIEKVRGGIRGSVIKDESVEMEENEALEAKISTLNPEDKELVAETEKEALSPIDDAMQERIDAVATLMDNVYGTDVSDDWVAKIKNTKDLSAIEAELQNQEEELPKPTPRARKKMGR
jgi:hypothetical protein